MLQAAKAGALLLALLASIRAASVPDYGAELTSGGHFELLHQLTGPNEETGGEATGLVYRLVRDRRRGKGGGTASGGRP